jgi:hypothetical protein
LCLIEFIDLRYSQSCWYFRPQLQGYAFIQCVTGGEQRGIGLFGENTVYTGVMHCAFDQIPNLHCKERLMIFLSPDGMSLTKLSMAGNNLIFPGQGELGK